MYTCRRCGQPVGWDAPHALCPACLLGAARHAPDRGAGMLSGAAVPQPAQTRFGDYELIEEIARGGMGVVHKARQLKLDRIVALKLVLGGRLAGADLVRRFAAEAQVAARLHHPHIVAIHDVGEHEGQLFFSMDYIEGRNLAQIISDSRFQNADFRRGVRWMKTAAEAVHYAHAHGVLHRDLKPANIIIDRDDQPHITDFGLAKQFRVPPSSGPAVEAQWAASGLGTPPAEAGTATELTLSGQVLGSPSFLSPEQAEGKRGQVGVPSDAYSLGAVLYHLLTGRPPFQGETLTALLRQVVENEPVAPRLLNPSIPRDLETICLKCLEKEPRRRYVSTNELADELGRFLEDEPIRARRAGRAERGWRWCRRNPRLAGALGAAVVSLVFGVAGIAWQWRRAEAGERLALERAYASDIDLASRALAEDNLGRVRELLNRYRPATVHPSRLTDQDSLAPRPSPLAPGLRGWEWAYLWEKSRSQAAFRFCTRPKSIGGLAFNRDGGRLIVHEMYGETAVYDVASRRPIPGLVQANTSPRMAYSPATDQVAFLAALPGLQDYEILVWDLGSNTVSSRFNYRYLHFESLAFSPDGCRLAGLSGSGACVWEVATSNLLVHIPVRTPHYIGGTGSIAFGPSGDLLAIGDQNGTVRVHKLPGREVEAEFRFGDDHTTALAISPDGRWLAASCLKNAVALHVWALPSRDEIDLPGMKGGAWALAFAGANALLAAGQGQAIGLWDLAQRRQLAPWLGHRSAIWSLAFSPDGRFLASGSAAVGSDDGEVLFWDVDRVRRTGQVDCLTVAHRPPGGDAPDTKGVAFAPDSGTFLALVGGCLTRHNAETLAALEPLPRYGTNLVRFAQSADGRWLVTADAGGTVLLWDHTNGRMRSSFRPYPDQTGVYGLQVLANGRLVTSVDYEGAVPLRIWDTSASPWREWKGWRASDHQLLEWIFHADASPEGRLLATGHQDGKVRWWEIETGREVACLQGHRERVYCVAFSPDGRQLASCGSDGSVRLWDVVGRRELGRFANQPAPVYGVAFSPDGRRLVSSGVGGKLAVVLWDVATRQHLFDLPEPGVFHTCPQFSPDGRTLAVESTGRTSLWRVPAMEEIDRREGRTAGSDGRAGESPSEE